MLVLEPVGALSGPGFVAGLSPDRDTAVGAPFHVDALGLRGVEPIMLLDNACD